MNWKGLGTRVTKIVNSGWLESLNQWLIYNSDYLKKNLRKILYYYHYYFCLFYFAHMWRISFMYWWSIIYHPSIRLILTTTYKPSILLPTQCTRNKRLTRLNTFGECWSKEDFMNKSTRYWILRSQITWHYSKFVTLSHVTVMWLQGIMNLLQVIFFLQLAPKWQKNHCVLATFLLLYSPYWEHGRPISNIYDYQWILIEINHTIFFM